MSRFRNKDTGIVVSVDDSKDARFGSEWVSADAPLAAIKPPQLRPRKTTK